MGNASCASAKQPNEQKNIQPAQPNNDSTTNTTEARRFNRLGVPEHKTDLLEPQISENRTLGLTSNDSDWDEEHKVLDSQGKPLVDHLDKVTGLEIDHFDQILEEQFEHYRLAKEAQKVIVSVEVHDPEEFKRGYVVSEKPIIIMTFDDGA